MMPSFPSPISLIDERAGLDGLPPAFPTPPAGPAGAAASPIDPFRRWPGWPIATGILISVSTQL